MAVSMRISWVGKWRPTSARVFLREIIELLRRSSYAGPPQRPSPDPELTWEGREALESTRPSGESLFTKCSRAKIESDAGGKRGISDAIKPSNIYVYRHTDKEPQSRISLSFKFHQLLHDAF